MVVFGATFLSALLVVRFAHAQQGSAKKVTLTTAQAAGVHLTPAAGPMGITAPVKLCSGVLDGKWRDTITVPDSWSIGACQTFASAIGADTYQLGCANQNGISFGAGNNANPPSPNCGW
jgi:hypothetical protein